MARPVRVNVAGGWYHVTARGIERRAIFEDGRDHKHFLELLSAMTERYGVCARQRSGLTLRAIGAALGMKEYKTVAKAIQRFASAMPRDATKRRLVRECLNEMANVE